MPFAHTGPRCLLLDRRTMCTESCCDLQPIEFEEFCAIIKAKKDTAPGPDGVSNSAWAIRLEGVQ
eukprot:335205-Heterocapsa_arctica.AAC.1